MKSWRPSWWTSTSLLAAETLDGHNVKGACNEGEGEEGSPTLQDNNEAMDLLTGAPPKITEKRSGGGGQLKGLAWQVPAGVRRGPLLSRTSGWRRRRKNENIEKNTKLECTL